MLSLPFYLACATLGSLAYACNQANIHNIPECAQSAAVSAGDALGILTRCGTDACCWCRDHTFTSSLNETWKDCSMADQEQAYRFFLEECGTNHTSHANVTSPSSLHSVHNGTPSATSTSTDLLPLSSATTSLSSFSTASVLSSSSSTPGTSTASPTLSSSAVHSDATINQGQVSSIIAIAVVIGGTLWLSP